MRRRCVSGSRDVAASLCQPAVRMVVLRATGLRENGEWRSCCELFPVVAIRSTIHQRWGKSYYDGEQPPYFAGTPRELVKDGWSLNHQVETTSALVIDDGVLVAHDSPDFVYSAERTSLIVACPWPPEEDGERLRDKIGELKAEALKRAQWSEEQRSKDTAAK